MSLRSKAAIFILNLQSMANRGQKTSKCLKITIFLKMHKMRLFKTVSNTVRQGSCDYATTSYDAIKHNWALGGVVAKEIVDCMYNFSTRNLFLAIFIFATSFSCQSISPEKNLRRWTTVELEDMKKKPKTSCYDADFLTHNRMCLLLLCVCADAVVLQRENYSSKEKNTYQNLMICYRLQPFITTHFSLSCFSNFFCYCILLVFECRSGKTKAVLWPLSSQNW